MFKSILAGIGRALVAIGKGAIKTAVYITDHPAVVAAGEAIAVQAGANAQVVGKVDQGVQTVSQVTNVVRGAKSGS